MNFIKDIYYTIIFLADEKYNKNPYIIEKLISFIKLVATFAPIAFFLNIINLWFSNNREFVSGFLIVVAMNAYYGIKKHRKSKTFDHKIFLKKTGQMLTLVIGVYILLSIVGNFTGDSIASEAFQILIQVMTLFYPGSKALKSIFVLSDGDYPPKWIMKRVYNFEENGDMGDLFKTKKDEEQEDINNENLE